MRLCSAVPERRCDSQGHAKGLGQCVGLIKCSVSVTGGDGGAGIAWPVVTVVPVLHDSSWCWSQYCVVGGDSTAWPVVTVVTVPHGRWLLPCCLTPTERVSPPVNPEGALQSFTAHSESVRVRSFPR